MNILFYHVHGLEKEFQRKETNIRLKHIYIKMQMCKCVLQINITPQYIKLMTLNYYQRHNNHVKIK